MTNKPDMASFPAKTIFIGYSPGRTLHPAENPAHVEKIVEVLCERQREAESCQYQIYCLILGRNSKYYEHLVILDQPTPGSTAAHELTKEVIARFEFYRANIDHDLGVASRADQGATQ